ncbi:hypothetical protein ACL02R_05320 [Streptomyces sp. MS19]|uniref:hypothetical protein n=1 Tax=Streptomyces sp. MS19 TaxID=3385972 RepID=UPI0039A2164B
MVHKLIGQIVVAGALGAVSGMVAALGPTETARRALVRTDRAWWRAYRRALIALGENPDGFDTTAPDPADVALGLGVFAALDHAAHLRRAMPTEAELAFRILTDPDPDPDN